MEKGTMARRSKRDYLASIQARDQRARRAEKTAILDEFTTVCGSHRTYALRLLHQSAPASSRPRRRVARRLLYSEAVIGLLAHVWEAAGSLCAQRLKAALPTWLRRRVQLSPLVAQQLSGSLLKHMIPVKTDHWDVTTPGYLEMDLVSHSGACAVGEFLQALDCVDMHTCWVERQAVFEAAAYLGSLRFTHCDLAIPRHRLPRFRP